MLECVPRDTEDYRPARFVSRGLIRGLCYSSSDTNISCVIYRKCNRGKHKGVFTVFDDDRFHAKLRTEASSEKKNN